MALPPFVVVHGKRTNGVDSKGKPKPIFLGVNGWTPHRNEAVSCTSEFEARSWLEETNRQTPALIANSDARVERHEDGTAAPFGGMTSDYDPYAERV